MIGIKTLVYNGGNNAFTGVGLVELVALLHLVDARGCACAIHCVAHAARYFEPFDTW